MSETLIKYNPFNSYLNEMWLSKFTGKYEINCGGQLVSSDVEFSKTKSDVFKSFTGGVES